MVRVSKVTGVVLQGRQVSAHPNSRVNTRAERINRIGAGHSGSRTERSGHGHDRISGATWNEHRQRTEQHCAVMDRHELRVSRFAADVAGVECPGGLATRPLRTVLVRLAS